MKTVNSLSGGKTSSYIAVNYPADYNVFSLVRTNDLRCLYPDAKLRQIVSDKIGKEFIGTLEDDTIIHTMLDLEQYIGKEISWLSAKTFDEVCERQGGEAVYIPNASMRFCTIEMKINPIAQWCYDHINEPVEMRIGFRANETKRAKSMIDRCEVDGFEHHKVVQSIKNGRRKWELYKYRKPSFPLIDDVIFKDQIEEFWKGKSVRFAWMNNCIGCFNSNPILLKKQSQKHPEKFNWFVETEKQSQKTYKDRKWLGGLTNQPSYDEIRNWNPQIELFDDDFNECDSGYCGL